MFIHVGNYYTVSKTYQIESRVDLQSIIDARDLPNNCLLFEVVLLKIIKIEDNV